jgi:hypothetical protein
LQLVGFAAYQRNPRAQSGQFMRRAAADAGAATGDHHHFASEQAWRKHGCIRHKLTFCFEK